MITIVTKDGKTEKELLLNASKRAGENDKKAVEIAEKVIFDVIKDGDKALKEYTKRFDNCDIENFELTKEVWESAALKADKELIDALKEAALNIEKFHKKQLKEGFEIKEEDGSIIGQRVRALNRVGIYVPGGTAAYPSSVLMNAIPAKVAGVKEVIMVTPPFKDEKDVSSVLAAAKIAGVDKVYTVGGAQAVAALAYGTESIEAVDKITGPGNIFVAAAKKVVYGKVDIDMIAGPSEVLVIADDNANPKYVAADLLAQAEHDPFASSVLLCFSEDFAKKVDREIIRQTDYLSRKDIIEKSIKDFGMAIVCNSINDAVEIANEIAPEHLEVLCENSMEILPDLLNAGSIFLGEYSPEPLGDYMAGPNHVLPTSGTARFFSPLSCDSFIKKTSFIYSSKEGLENKKDKIIKIANSERLTAHANSVAVRFEK